MTEKVTFAHPPPLRRVKNRSKSRATKVCPVYFDVCFCVWMWIR